MVAKKIINRNSKKNNKFINITEKYYIKYDKNKKIILISIIVILLLLLIFKKHINYGPIIEKIYVFLLIFSIVYLISNKLKYSILISAILFLVINLMINNTNFVERFEGAKDSDSKSSTETNTKTDTNISSPAKVVTELDKIMTPEAKKATSNIQELLKKANGGIALETDDLKETTPLGVETSKYSNDKTPNALKDAQKETYALIDTVSTLKDTIESLSQVLKEGKKLMEMFESLKI